MSTIMRYGQTARLSRIVVHHGTAYFSGLTATDRTGGVEDQTGEILTKFDELLISVGADRTRILFAQIWLRDIADFTGMNSVWEAWMDPEHLPARATVESKMASPDIRVEMQFTVAVVNESSAKPLLA